MKKRGVSTIVATVLIVLITVAGVTALWAGIYPMLNQIAFNEDMNLRLTIDKQGGYTIFDDENGVLSLRIKRAADEADIIALKFVIDIEGNSQVYKRYTVPSINTAKIYYFGLGFIEGVTSAKVVPIYNAGGEEFEGSYYTYLDDIPKASDALDNLGEKDGLVCADEKYPGQNDGLVLYYDFEEIYNGNEIFDLSCKGHKGTLQGGSQIVPDEERGMAIELDGTSGYVDLAERGSLATQTGGSKTIAFWVKPECKDGDSTVFGSYRNFYMSFFSNSDCSFDMTSFCLENDDETTHCFNWYNSIIQDKWHHYAFVVDIAPSHIEGKLFIDGEQIVPNPNVWEETHGNINNNFYFGTFAQSQSGPADESTSFDGLIDEFRIYNKVLMPEEISSLYATSQK